MAITIKPKDVIPGKILSMLFKQLTRRRFASDPKLWQYAFMKQFQENTLGRDGSSTVFLPYATPAPLILSDSKEKNLNDLQAEVGAQAKSLDFVQGQNIFNTLEQIYEGRQIGGKQPPDTDKMTLDALNDQIYNWREQINQLYDQKVKWPQQADSLDRQIQTLNNSIDIANQQMKTIQNKDPSASMNYLYNQYMKNKKIGTSWSPQNLKDIVNTPDLHSNRYVTKKGSITQRDSTSVDFKERATFSSGWWIFSVRATQEHQSYSMMDYFGRMDYSMDITLASFNRPYLDYTVFDMDGLSIPQLKKGAISSGSDFQRLTGSLALIPQQVVIAKNIKFTFSERTNSKESTFDKASGGFGIWVFDFDLADVQRTWNASHSMATSLSYEQAGPFILGYINSITPEFPKVDAGHQHMLKTEPVIPSFMLDHFSAANWRFGVDKEGPHYHDASSNLTYKPHNQGLYYRDTKIHTLGQSFMRQQLPEDMPQSVKRQVQDLCQRDQSQGRANFGQYSQRPRVDTDLLQSIGVTNAEEGLKLHPYLIKEILLKDKDWQEMDNTLLHWSQTGNQDSLYWDLNHRWELQYTTWMDNTSIITKDTVKNIKDDECKAAALQVFALLEK